MVCYNLDLFFYFTIKKQQTRLQGDWSSDVCSSDLSPLDRRVRLRGALSRQAGEPDRTVPRRNVRRRNGRLLSAVRVQIGRASCRESDMIFAVNCGVHIHFITTRNMRTELMYGLTQT